MENESHQTKFLILSLWKKCQFDQHNKNQKKKTKNEILNCEFKALMFGNNEWHVSNWNEPNSHSSTSYHEKMSFFLN